MNNNKTRGIYTREYTTEVRTKEKIIVFCWRYHNANNGHADPSFGSQGELVRLENIPTTQAWASSLGLS